MLFFKMQYILKPKLYMVIFSQKLECMRLGARNGSRSRLSHTDRLEECVLNSPTALGSAGLESLVWGEVREGMLLSVEIEGLLVNLLPWLPPGHFGFLLPKINRQSKRSYTGRGNET